MLLRGYGPPVLVCSYYSQIMCKIYANSRNLFLIVPEPSKSKTKAEAVLESSALKYFIADLDMVNKSMV